MSLGKEELDSLGTVLTDLPETDVHDAGLKHEVPVTQREPKR